MGTGIMAVMGAFLFGIGVATIVEIIFPMMPEEVEEVKETYSCQRYPNSPQCVELRRE